jgi:hypothetical protein
VDGTPLREGRTYEKTGGLVAGTAMSGADAHEVAETGSLVARTELAGSRFWGSWSRLLRRPRLGRPPQDARAAEWAARLKTVEFLCLFENDDREPSLRAKCRQLAQLEHEEAGGDPDNVDERELGKRADVIRKAVRSWEKKGP